MITSKSLEQLSDFAAAVRPRLRGELRLDAMSCALYATDASMYQIEPLGVLIPESVEDVHAAIEEAARFGIPVLPRGSGSSLAGSAVGAALVIDTTRHLDKFSINPEERTVTVQPGVVLDHVNLELAKHGLTIGPDPASSSRATLGGMIGTNATGTHSIRYGSVVDHIREAELLLPGGTMTRFGSLSPEMIQQKMRLPGEEGALYRSIEALLGEYGEAIRRDTSSHWRRAGGYRLERLLDRPEKNLAHLLCGSEGTLGFVTEATLSVVELPRRTALGVAHFPTRHAALEAVVAILETNPFGVELLDSIIIVRARQVVEYASKLHFVQGEPGALLAVEYEGESAAELNARMDQLSKVLGPSVPVTCCLDSRQMQDVWDVRKVGLGLAMSARLPIQSLAFIEDASVPVEHLPAYIRRLEEVMAGFEIDAVMYAHASAGCLHVRPFLDPRKSVDRERMVAIAEASADLVKEYGGIISSEHGDGLARSWLAPRIYGKELYEAYRGIKRAFDPENRFNPGRVVEAYPMDENLRHDLPVQAMDWQPEMDWSASFGFGAAVESCNGQGVCRKHLSGTMCPSFMVTRDEQDSTRGRANALRNVISGNLPPETLTGKEMQEVMDLCLSCKACKSECPAGVDMAAMKVEWQAYRWKHEKPPLRTRMIAHQPKLAKLLAGPLAPSANAVTNSPMGKFILRKIGFAEGRSLPPFARKPFRKKSVSAGGRQVVLYADTFARFHEPEIPEAAVAVLEAAGFDVIIPPYRCCGRTLISKGFLKEARKNAVAVLDTYAEYAQQNIPIIGLEPSCLLTLRDEIPRLLPDDDRVRAVADVAVLFEEFVATNAATFCEVFNGDSQGEVLLHGHCHQKALSGAAPSIVCLESAGFNVRFVDAGCCGMAGSFGYEAEHEDISRKMAERVLAPTVRKTPENVPVVAAGTSCRHQIADTTGRVSIHPAVLMAEALLQRPS